jgi:hypothetical protein
MSYNPDLEMLKKKIVGRKLNHMFLGSTWTLSGHPAAENVNACRFVL